MADDDFNSGRFSGDGPRFDPNRFTIPTRQEPASFDPREFLTTLHKGRRYLVGGLLAIVVIVLGYSSFFQVEPDEQALVLRFGAPIGGDVAEVFGPGLHFKIPFVDEAYVLPVERQHRIEFGFRSEPGKVTTVTEEGEELDSESQMLTGDLLLVHVRWSLIYRIDDIATWLFKIKDDGGEFEELKLAKEETIRDISRAVMRQLVGDYSLHEVLTTRVREIQDLAKIETERALKERIPTGVTITELSIRNADVPASAKPAFDEFNRTEPDVTRQLSEAKAEQHNVTGNAEQEKKRAIGRAERKRAEIVRNAIGEALAFQAKLAEYKQAPEITRQWMFLETMAKVLDNVEDKIIIQAGNGDNGVLKLLPLGDLSGTRLPRPVTPVPPVPATEVGR